MGMHWFFYQHCLSGGTLRPLFLVDEEPVLTVEQVEEAAKGCLRAIGPRMADYLDCLGLTDTALAMRTLRPIGEVLRWEDEALERIHSDRRNMVPETRLYLSLTREYQLPPMVVKRLMDVALEAMAILTHRTTDQARAVDTEVYRELGNTSALTGDPRAAIASQKALTVTQGTARQISGAGFTLGDILKTMKELGQEEDTAPAIGPPPAIGPTPITDHTP